MRAGRHVLHAAAVLAVGGDLPGRSPASRSPRAPDAHVHAARRTRSSSTAPSPARSSPACRWPTSAAASSGRRSRRISRRNTFLTFGALGVPIPAVPRRHRRPEDRVDLQPRRRELGVHAALIDPVTAVPQHGRAARRRRPGRPHQVRGRLRRAAGRHADGGEGGDDPKLLELPPGADPSYLLHDATICSLPASSAWPSSPALVRLDRSTSPAAAAAPMSWWSGQRKAVVVVCASGMSILCVGHLCVFVATALQREWRRGCAIALPRRPPPARRGCHRRRGRALDVAP